MSMNMNEKKALYAFGCPNRKATVERLKLLATLAPEPTAKKLFRSLAAKLSDEDADRWYRCFFYNMRLEIESDLDYRYGRHDRDYHYGRKYVPNDWRDE